jgi:small subunit ribosomal protein S17
MRKKAGKKTNNGKYLAMKKRGIKRQVVGTIVGNKMDKTVIVLVERLVMHPFYHKHIRRRSRFAAHDEANACNIGDKVRITESRPISRTKRWRVSEIVEKAL